MRRKRIAEPSPLIGQIAQLRSQLDLRRSRGPIAYRLSIGRYDLAGPPFRKPHHGLQMRHGFTLRGSPYHFFEKLTKSGNVQHLLCQLLLQPGAGLAQFAAMIGLEYESVTLFLTIISRPKGRLNSKRVHCRPTAIWTILSGFRTAC